MRLLAVAGELSGDGHGGPLLEGLRRHLPGVQVYGIGGPRMRRAGLNPLHPFESLQVHGLLELVGHLPRLYRVLWSLEDWLERERPDAVLLIDYPGFNLKLARAARRLGIPVLFYSSPQIWAWRGGRIRTIAEVVDWMFVLFPFEVPLYEKAGVRVRFLGHPLVGQSATEDEVQALQAQLADTGDDPELPLVAVMPGSRPSELRRHLGTMLEAVAQIRATGYAARWILPVAGSLDAAAVRAQVAASGQPVRVVEEAFLPTLRLADLAIVCSGTATLQVGMAGIPFLVVYRVAPLSWWLLKTFAYVPYISIVNLLEGEAVAPELLQENFTAERIRKAFLPIAQDSQTQARIRERLLAATGRLGEPGAYERAAAALAEILQGGVPDGLDAGPPLPAREARA